MKTVVLAALVFLYIAGVDCAPPLRIPQPPRAPSIVRRRADVNGRNAPVPIARENPIPQRRRPVNGNTLNKSVIRESQQAPPSFFVPTVGIVNKEDETAELWYRAARALANNPFLLKWVSSVDERVEQAKDTIVQTAQPIENEVPKVEVRAKVPTPEVPDYFDTPVEPKVRQQKSEPIDYQEELPLDYEELEQMLPEIAQAPISRKQRIQPVEEPVVTPVEEFVDKIVVEPKQLEEIPMEDEAVVEVEAQPTIENKPEPKPIVEAIPEPRKELSDFTTAFFKNLGLVQPSSAFESQFFPSFQPVRISKNKVIPSPKKEEIIEETPIMTKSLVMDKEEQEQLPINPVKEEEVIKNIDTDVIPLDETSGPEPEIIVEVPENLETESTIPEEVVQEKEIPKEKERAESLPEPEIIIEAVRKVSEQEIPRPPIRKTRPRGGHRFVAPIAARRKIVNQVIPVRVEATIPSIPPPIAEHVQIKEMTAETPEVNTQVLSAEIPQESVTASKDHETMEEEPVALNREEEVTSIKEVEESPKMITPKKIDITIPEVPQKEIAEIQKQMVRRPAPKRRVRVQRVQANGGKRKRIRVKVKAQKQIKSNNIEKKTPKALVTDNFSSGFSLTPFQFPSFSFSVQHIPNHHG